jgi:RNA polymerase sigma-70 factor (ECF subfamily)
MVVGSTLYASSDKGYLKLGYFYHKAGSMGKNTEHQAQENDQAQQVGAEQIALMRDEMLRFSILQLRDATLAEDVVHEAIIAALAPDKYSGRGSLKSWVFAILRNKIIDAIRQRSRHPTELFIEDGADPDDQFNENGHWKKTQKPTHWGPPDKILASEQFWVVFKVCLNELPENTARVFMMREHLGLELKEICQELKLSNSNAWVIMHRARMQLRKCLEINYMQGELL